jgi:REP element-mobilizing transposase RayT
MPDHIHLLVRLTGEGSLAEYMRLLKGRIAPALRTSGLKWQEGFYEHRLREKEEVVPVFLYIYLNPYRAELLSPERIWPGYYCAPDDWKWFGALTCEAVPQPEWLR